MKELNTKRNDFVVVDDNYSILYKVISKTKHGEFIMIRYENDENDTWIREDRINAVYEVKQK